MPVNFVVYMAAVKRDNPTYERILRSDLRPITQLLQRGNYSVDALKRAYQRVSESKWRKYSTVQQLLVSTHPVLMQAEIKRFKTISCKAAKGGLQHLFVAESTSRRLDQLAHLQMREKVRWNPSTEVGQYVREQGYRTAGNHTGRQASSAAAQQHEDVHGFSVAEMWDMQRLATLAQGKKLTFSMDQEYEWKPIHGGQWAPIPQSRFTIERTVQRKQGKFLFTLKKTGNGVNATAKLSLDWD